MFRLLRWIFCFVWLIFSIWMFFYEMPISGAYALAMLWCFLPSERKLGTSAWLVLILSPAVIWNVGLIEYGRKTIDLHCRVIGYAGGTSSLCSSYGGESYAAGLAHTEGPLFSESEQIAVHGFNVILATGGFLVGLPEVAWETLYMSFAKDPSDIGMSNEPKRIRLKQCKGGSSSQKVDKSSGNGDFLLDSSAVRKVIAPLVSKAKKAEPGKPKKFSPKSLVFKAPKGHSSKTNDNSYYGGLMEDTGFKAPITLVVPDGALHIEAYRESGEEAYFDITWKGTISYPSHAQFTFSLPTIWQHPALTEYTKMTGPFPLLVSEGIFCGMTIDGAMNPYTQLWKTRVPVSDSRFGPTEKLESKHGWIESLLKHVL